MDTASLKTLLTLVETGSFSATAEQLKLTQPAISKRIAALEKEFKTPLFDRIGKHTQATQAGQALQQSAQRILNEIEECQRIISNISNEISGHLKLATSHHIGLHRLPPVLKMYTSKHPDVQLDIHFLDSEQGCLAVEQGAIELAVVTLPDKPSENLNTQEIWQDPLAVVVGHDHELNKIKKPNLKQLSQYPAILPARGTFTRRIIERLFHTNNIELSIMLETNYLETIKMQVSIGLGWSILPISMSDKDIKTLSINELRLKRSLGYAHHRSRTLSNAAKALIKMLQTNGSNNQ